MTLLELCSSDVKRYIVRVRPHFVGVCLSVAFACALMGCSFQDAMTALSKVGQASQWLGSVLAVADSGQEAYFSRHPNEANERAVGDALRRARKALVALDAAVAAAESADAGDLTTARAEAISAYTALHDLLVDLGVTSARAPLGGAETEAPLPVPFDLPDPSELRL